MNDYIRRHLTHVAYLSVDVALIIHALGFNTLLAKIDIRNAYCIILIHPNDRPFLGIRWWEQIFVNCQLPFGLASALAIFSTVTTSLEWIIRQRGVHACIHYMDDFLLFGSPHSAECQSALAITVATCQELGIPLATDKIEGPAVALSFLGVQLDTAAMCVSLPADKLAKLRELIHNLVAQRTVHDFHALDSLVGHLVHATKVCPLGKAFLNNLFAVQSAMKAGQIRRLNLAARADLGWWQSFLTLWSGTSIQQFLILRKPDHHLYTDASGTWGCAAWSATRVFQLPWPAQSALSTSALQLPIVLACALWGHQWAGSLVL